MQRSVAQITRAGFLTFWRSPYIILPLSVRKHHSNLKMRWAKTFKFTPQVHPPKISDLEVRGQAFWRTNLYQMCIYEEAEGTEWRFKIFSENQRSIWELSSTLTLSAFVFICICTCALMCEASSLSIKDNISYQGISLDLINITAKHTYRICQWGSCTFPKV